MSLHSSLPFQLALLASLFASCAATAPPIETPSGRPECTIEGAELAKVQNYILENFMADGWMLREQTDSQLVMWKENTNTMQNALLGSRYDSTTTVEARFIFPDSGGPVRVFGQVGLLTNEGSAYEQRNDMTGGQAGYDLWQALLRVERHFEGAPSVAGTDPGDAGEAEVPEGESE